MSKPEAIGELIGRGNVAEVFAFGDHVLKLYRPGADPAVALGEALAMAVAAGHGLPVPQVFSVAEHGGRWGVEMARAAGVPLAQVVEMTRGKGVRLQRYKDGGLSDLKVFSKDTGLTWSDSSGRSFTRTVTELTEWLGDRATAGRQVPSGFPRNNRFVG